VKAYAVFITYFLKTGQGVHLIKTLHDEYYEENDLSEDQQIKLLADCLEKATDKIEKVKPGEWWTLPDHDDRKVCHRFLAQNLYGHVYGRLEARDLTPAKE
jgi:20S proteasome alpha/beta subunit